MPYWRHSTGRPTYRQLAQCREDHLWRGFSLPFISSHDKATSLPAVRLGPSRSAA